MATSTEVIVNLLTSPVLASAVIAAFVSGLINFFNGIRQEEEERYENFYGPLRYHLLMMKVITDNHLEVESEIREKFTDAEMIVSSLQRHTSPLITQWHNHKEAIKALIETKISLVRKNDFPRITKFLDACLKREIAQEGANSLATDQRMQEIIDAIKELQDYLL